MFKVNNKDTRTTPYTGLAGIHIPVRIKCLIKNSEAAAGGGVLQKTRLQYRCFPANIAKFLRMFILKNICGRLLLKI